MTLSTICSEDVDARFAEIIAAEWPKLTGRQTPEALLYTPGDFELGGKAVALGRLSASRIRLMPWQVWSLERIMAKDPDGTWTHPNCCLIVPRQNGKSMLLLLRVLYGLFKLGENIVFSAHQWVTAKALWKRAWHIVKTTPWMAKRVEAHTCSQGRGTIELASGAVVVFTTRSANAGRGLDCTDLVIYDEAYDLTEADMAALSPTKMAADDPQTIYTSSAVNADQHLNGEVLAAQRRRGLAKREKRYFFAEWTSSTGDRALPSTWRLANPSYGVIQTDKKLEADFLEFSTPAGQKSFDVEYLGRGDWPGEREADDWYIDSELWSGMTNANPVLVGQTAIGVAMSEDRKWVTIAAAQRTAEDRIHLEVGYHDAPTKAVVERLMRLIGAWDPCCLAFRGGKAPEMSLATDLLAQGIEPETASSTVFAQACGGFYDDAVNGILSHSDDPRLATALASARSKNDGGVPEAVEDGWISPLDAAVLARWGLLTFGFEQQGASAPAGDDVTNGAMDEFDALSAAF